MYDFPSLTLPSPSIPLYQSRRLFRRRVSTLSEPFEMIDPKPKKNQLAIIRTKLNWQPFQWNESRVK